MKIVNLQSNETSLKKLRQFYEGVYTDEFPDVDERELRENMENYLKLRDEGWYQKNNYYILLLENEQEEIVGGVVADYFDRSNVGIIEFMVVSAECRGQGLGKLLLQEIMASFREDSHRAGHPELNAVCGEVNDPYRRCDVEEHLDGFARLRMWHRFGFRLLDFPYVQPALSEGQAPVEGLGLMFRSCRKDFDTQVPAGLVKVIVADYLIWAMRIPIPEANDDFLKMQRWLAGRGSVKLIDMQSYVCAETSPPFEVVEVGADDEVMATQFAAVYSAAFQDEETTVDVSEFAKGTRSSQEPLAHHYWLWGVRENGSEQLAGLASFFSFPHCGFVGYAALSGAIQRKERIKRFFRLIEKQIVMVNGIASGWYAECDPGSAAARIAHRFGFSRVSMVYRQPRLHTDKTGVSEGKVLDLFYKPLGRIYFPPVLTLSDLMRDLREILARIYYLDRPGLNNALSRMSWPETDLQNVLAKSSPDKPYGVTSRSKSAATENGCTID